MTVKSLGDLANITVQNVVGETLCWITIVNWQLPPRVEVGCLRHPGDSTIVSQLTDGDNSMADKCWQASYEPTRRKEKNKHSKHIANTWRKTWSNRGGETAYEKESPCLKCNKHSRKCCPMQKTATVPCGPKNTWNLVTCADINAVKASFVVLVVTYALNSVKLHF